MNSVIIHIPTDDEILDDLYSIFQMRGGIHHTDFFETEYSKKPNAIELAKRVLTPEELEDLNLDELVVEKKDFSDPQDFFALRADLIYSIPYKNKDQDFKLYILFEHKSRSSRTAILQMFFYNTQIYLLDYEKHRHTKGRKGKYYLPEIVPVLYYSGKKPFKSPLTLDHLFPAGNKSNLHFQARIRDLSVLSDEELEIKPNALEFGLVENLMRDMWRPTERERLAYLQKHLTQLAQDRRNYHFLNYAMGYVSGCQDNNNRTQFMDMFENVYNNRGLNMKVNCILDQVKKDWMTIGMERGIKQGIEQGIEQEMENGMVKERKRIVQVLQHFNCSIPKRVINRINEIHDTIVLDSLFESALEAKSLEQFIADLP